KEKFRSSAWIRFGTPLQATEWAAAHPEAGARELSEDIAQKLRGLTLNFRRRRESALFQWAAEVLATRGVPPPLLGREQRQLPERANFAGVLSDGDPKPELTPAAEMAEADEPVPRY